MGWECGRKNVRNTKQNMCAPGGRNKRKRKGKVMDGEREKSRGKRMNKDKRKNKK